MKFTVYNDRFTVVCTGQTVKVFHKNTKDELARFRDMKYAYRAAFNPTMNMLFVKSTEPWIAFYCLDTMTLIRKIRITWFYGGLNDQPQDGGFCFSHDGRYLFNLEGNRTEVTVSPMCKFFTHLVKYDCQTFEGTERLFTENKYIFNVIERHEDGYLLSGQEIGNLFEPSKTIIAKFDGEKITYTKEVIYGAHDYPDPYAEIYYQ